VQDLNHGLEQGAEVSWETLFIQIKKKKRAKGRSAI